MPVSDRSLLPVVWGVVSLGTGRVGGCSGLGPDSVAGTRVGVGVRVKVQGATGVWELELMSQVG